MASKSKPPVSISRHAPVALLAVALVGAGIFAVFHSDSPTPAEPEPRIAEEPTARDLPGDPNAAQNTLPPDHPAIGAMTGDPNAAMMNAAPASANVKWTAPPAWKTVPSPSKMRLATYSIPHVAGDTDDPELSVIQAGGSNDANIERWVGQFENAGKETRTPKTIHGLAVTLVEVKGSYSGGGMMPGGASGSHPGWALLAAIVETPNMPTFFKMVGPEKSVAAARPGFDALLASVTTVKPPAP